MMMLRRFAGYVWASPATVLGLAGASLALWRGRIELRQGVVEARGPALRWALTHLSLLPGGIAAITLGHVVLGRDAHTLDSTRAHERVHVRQYERWGMFMLPAYVLASVWAWARGAHFYFDNPFERQAFGNHEGRFAAGTKNTKGTRNTKGCRYDTVP
jgi:hypothetical protein